MKKIFLIFFLLISLNPEIHAAASTYWCDNMENVLIDTQAYGKIKSTQILAKEQAGEIARGSKIMDPSKLYIITAEEQTEGIGLEGRSWSSPVGNIFATYSFLVPLDKMEIFFSLSQAQIMTLSTAEVLEKLGFYPQIRWVNDLILSDKKMCGIMGEPMVAPTFIIAIIGIGLNINMSLEECGGIDLPATSLKIESRREYPTEEILALITNQLIQNTRLFIKEGSRVFYPKINSRLAYIGRKVTVESKKEVFHTGIFTETNEEGHMVMQTTEGQETLEGGRIIRVF